MPKFEVSITRTITLTTSIEVSAKNEDAAEEKALTIAQEGMLIWTIQDNNEWQEESDDCTIDSVDAL